LNLNYKVLPNPILIGLIGGTSGTYAMPAKKALESGKVSVDLDQPDPSIVTILLRKDETFMCVQRPYQGLVEEQSLTYNLQPGSRR